RCTRFVDADQRQRRMPQGHIGQFRRSHPLFIVSLEFLLLANNTTGVTSSNDHSKPWPMSVMAMLRQPLLTGNQSKQGIGTTVLLDEAVVRVRIIYGCRPCNH